MSSHKVEVISGVLAVLGCLVLSAAFVLSFYVWKVSHRNHPSTIKRRFLSSFIMMIVSPAFVRLLIGPENALWPLLGLRFDGIVLATLLPLGLTALLFLGPIVMRFQRDQADDESVFQWACLSDLVWLRNYIVAPLSEEFIFRSCMLALLALAYSPQKAIIISSVFFGVGHLHHIVGHVYDGLDIRNALMISGFQFFYSSLFGGYAAFIFLRTGHFIAPFICHVFCNLMGFPTFHEILQYKEPRRSIIASLCVVGLVAWFFLLVPLTNPSIYVNDIHWKIYS